MNTLLIILAVLAVIPYVLAGATGYFRIKQFGHVDNVTPRAQYQALTGTGAHLFAAQQNAWEALALFTATVVVVGFSGIDASTLATPAWIFLATRIAQPVFYVTRLHVLRSIVVISGLGCCVYMLWCALSGG